MDNKAQTLEEASLAEMVAEVSRRYPDYEVEVNVVGHYHLGHVPKSKREGYEARSKRESREAGIRLGFLKCRKCNHRLELKEVCKC